MQVKTRLEAFNNGESRFYTGVVCRNGHLSERYTSTGQCIDCLRSWQVPRRSKLYKGNNVYFPQHPFVFPPGTTREQADAVFELLRTHWMEQAVAATAQMHPDLFPPRERGPIPALELAAAKKPSGGGRPPEDSNA